jgi:hypothetical protein
MKPSTKLDCFLDSEGAILSDRSGMDETTSTANFSPQSFGATMAVESKRKIPKAKLIYTCPKREEEK